MSALSNGISWDAYVPAANVVGGFATAIGILVGGFSLLLVWLQIHRGASVSREVAAFDAHKEYICLCIEYPHLSSSFMMKRHLGIDSFYGILENSSPETEQALWFFSYVLFAMEQLILTSGRWNGDDPAWRRTVVDQLSYHGELLLSVWPEWQSHYSEKMNEVVIAALSSVEATT